MCFSLLSITTTEELKSRPLFEEKERLLIVSNIKAVDKAILSIDKDRTVCNSIRQIMIEYGAKYKLSFANGGDQAMTQPEAELCEDLGISLIDNLGEKIQSSSWLLGQ